MKPAAGRKGSLGVGHKYGEIRANDAQGLPKVAPASWSAVMKRSGITALRSIGKRTFELASPFGRQSGQTLRRFLIRILDPSSLDPVRAPQAAENEKQKCGCKVNPVVPGVKLNDARNDL